MQPIAIERACGMRKEGGIYAMSLTSSHGQPIEYFLLDPPQPLNPQMGITPRGVTLAQIREDGPYHIFDWVGAEHYPNVYDWIEETRQHGASRRLPDTLDFSKLTLGSRMIMVHPRAIIRNFQAMFFDVRADARAAWQSVYCPKHTHVAFDCCLGLARWDIEGGTPVEHDPYRVRRTLPSTTYYGYHLLATSELVPEYEPGIFCSLPLHRIEVVSGGEWQKSHTKASMAEVPVEVVAA